MALPKESLVSDQLSDRGQDVQKVYETRVNSRRRLARSAIDRGDDPSGGRWHSQGCVGGVYRRRQVRDGQHGTIYGIAWSAVSGQVCASGYCDCSIRISSDGMGDTETDFRSCH